MKENKSHNIFDALWRPGLPPIASFASAASMLPGITPRPRNSEKRFRGSSRVSSAAGYQISVCKLLGPSWSFRLKSSSCMVVTPTGKGPGGFPVTRDTAIARPGARMWSSRKEKAVHRTVPQTRRPMRLTLSTLCSQQVMHGTEMMLRSHDSMCHTYTANHCKCACFNDNGWQWHISISFSDPIRSWKAETKAPSTEPPPEPKGWTEQLWSWLTW